MDYDIAQRFAPYLVAGETVRWTARPQQGLALRASDTAVIPFSIAWCGFAIFWETSVAMMPSAPPFMLLWGAMFVAIGLYFVFGRFLFDAFARSKTIYAVTNQRALILGGAFSVTLNAVKLSRAGEIQFTRHANGRGTIVFGSDRPLTFNGVNSRYARSVTEFFRVEDADTAYRLVQSAEA